MAFGDLKLCAHPWILVTCINIASHEAGGEGSEMNSLTFPHKGTFEYPFLLLFKSTMLPRYFPPVLLYSLYFLVYLHCRCLSLDITLRLSWPKSISCYWHLKYFLFQSSNSSTLSSIIWKFYEKYWENFMENIVYYFIHSYATSLKLFAVYAYLLYSCLICLKSNVPGWAELLLWGTHVGETHTDLLVLILSLLVQVSGSLVTSTRL